MLTELPRSVPDYSKLSYLHDEIWRIRLDFAIEMKQNLAPYSPYRCGSFEYSAPSTHTTFIICHYNEKTKSRPISIQPLSFLAMKLDFLARLINDACLPESSNKAVTLSSMKLGPNTIILVCDASDLPNLPKIGFSWKAGRSRTTGMCLVAARCQRYYRWCDINGRVFITWIVVRW